MAFLFRQPHLSLSGRKAHWMSSRICCGKQRKNSFFSLLPLYFWFAVFCWVKLPIYSINRVLQLVKNYEAFSVEQVLTEPFLNLDGALWRRPKLGVLPPGEIEAHHQGSLQPLAQFIFSYQLASGVELTTPVPFILSVTSELFQNYFFIDLYQVCFLKLSGGMDSSRETDTANPLVWFCFFK